MSDAAAFFAKKKKGGKKKSFKSFNANKIDASAVSSTVHVDAPAISAASKTVDIPAASTTTQSPPSTTNGSNAQASNTPNLVEEEWETPVPKTPSSSVVIPKKSQITELLDMNALEAQRREQDDVAERMRVEATKAALASAREGMEKEARRLKEEEEFKLVKGKAPVADTNRSAGGGGGTKWVPPHLRGGASAALGNSRMMMNKVRGKAASIDTKDAMDFPDLASANAAIDEQKRLEREQMEKQRLRAANRKSGITPWGSQRLGNRGASNNSSSKTKGASKATKEAVADVNPPSPPRKEEAPPAPTVAPPAAPVVSPVATTESVEFKKKKKKKKKDLSTFKASS